MNHPNQLTAKQIRTQEQALESAKSIAPLIASEANLAERSGVMAPSVASALRETGLFWFQVPQEIGGFGVDLVQAAEVLEEVSYADASVGWCLMASGSNTAYAAAILNDTAVDELFFSSEKSIVCGMPMPGGSAKRVPDGVRGSGKYRFASNASQANWFNAGMMVASERPGEEPVPLVCMVPRNKVQLHENWDVMGLRSTGSFDFSVEDQFIPEHFTFHREMTLPIRGGPWFSVKLTGLGYLGHSAVALGLMKRALAEVAGIAEAKTRRGYGSTVSDHHVFRYEFGLHEASYQAARAYLLSVTRELQDDLSAGKAFTPFQASLLNQSCNWIHKIGADVVRFSHIWGSSEAIRNPSALGRCMRDMYTATQHIFVDPNQMVDIAPAVINRWKKLAECLAPTN